MAKTITPMPYKQRAASPDFDVIGVVEGVLSFAALGAAIAFMLYFEPLSAQFYNLVVLYSPAVSSVCQ